MRRAGDKLRRSVDAVNRLRRANTSIRIADMRRPLCRKDRITAGTEKPRSCNPRAPSRHAHISTFPQNRIYSPFPIPGTKWRWLAFSRCYQDRTKESHLRPSRRSPALWFLVGLCCLRLDCRDFVNRRSVVRFHSPAPYIPARSMLRTVVRRKSCGILPFQISLPFFSSFTI
jgi:hypothetical protein